MNYWMTFLACFCACFVAVESNSFLPFNRGKQKRDCLWTPWVGGECTQRGKGDYRETRTRTKIRAKNGGKDCVGSKKSEKQCSEMKFLTMMFRASVRASLSSSTSSGASSGSSSGRSSPSSSGYSFESHSSHFELASHASVDERLCGKRIVDSNGVVRMVSSCNDLEHDLAFGYPEMNHRTKRQIQAGISIKVRDVLFLIDESGSVGKRNFEKFRNLTKAIIMDFCGTIDVGKFKTRVGVLTFDSKQHLHTDFDDFFDKTPLLSNLNSIRYSNTTHGSTCISDALKYSSEKVFISSKGARFHSDSEKLIMLLTDGCANCAIQRLQSEAVNLVRKNIALMTILVGKEQGRCMDIMERLENKNPCYSTLTLQNFAEVDEMIDEYKELGKKGFCTDAWSTEHSCPY